MTGPGDLEHVNLVLDTSAILGYVRGSDAVGEVIREVADGGLLVGLPTSCMAEAYLSAVTVNLLHVLVANPATVLLSDEPGEWVMLAQGLSLVGDLASASAALLAVDAGCQVLTARPQRYAGIGAGELALPFSD